MTTPTTKKIITVFGATGKQGGSVVKALLADPQTAARYHIRAATRDPTKASARALATLGAEPVAADLDDAPSLRAAMANAHAVFAVTNFWETMDPAVERAQGLALADAALATGVEHYIWSSLLNITVLSNGVLSRVQHFDVKADIEAHIRASALGPRASFFLPGMYMTNYDEGGSLRADPTDARSFTLAMPGPDDAPIPLLATAADTGKFVKGMIVAGPEAMAGRRVLGATEYLTPREMLAQLVEVHPALRTGFVQMSAGDFAAALRGSGVPEAAAEDLTQNMRLFGEFGYFGGLGLEESRGVVGEELTSWKEYVGASKVFQEAARKA